MVEWLRPLAFALGSRFRSRAKLKAENLVLRQQLNVLIRRLPKRLRLTNSDRRLLVWLPAFSFDVERNKDRQTRNRDPLAPPEAI
jgi:hypothetical protein